MRRGLAFDGDIKKEILHIYDVYLSYCLEAGIDFLSNYYTPKNRALATLFSALSAKPQKAVLPQRLVQHDGSGIRKVQRALPLPHRDADAVLREHGADLF